MESWIMAESTGNYFFYAFPIVLVVLLVMMKYRRVRFVIPSILITIAIVNPFFYKHWEELGLYAYWRILWIVPVIPVLAAFVPTTTEIIKSGVSANSKLFHCRGKLGNIGRLLIGAIGIAAICLGGTFVYTTDRGRFESQAGNGSKLPESVVKVADRLIELGGAEDNSIRIIAQYPIGVYIRQYTGRIDTLYGRDVDGYILGSSAAARNIHNQILNSEFEEASTTMLNDEFDYLVVDNRSEE